MGDTHQSNFDVVELLTRLVSRCVEVLGVWAAGVMLALPDGHLQVVASSSVAVRTVELFELQVQEGPCVDCFRTAEPVTGQDLAAERARWPRFAQSRSRPATGSCSGFR